MARTAWKDIYLLRVYEFAKAGMTERKMAMALGVSIQTFTIWEKKKKLFKQFLEEGRTFYKGKKNKDGKEISFREYVYQRLPDTVRKLWREIDKLDKAKSPRGLTEALLKRGGKRARQHLFLYAWTASNFSISVAMRKLCINKHTFTAWCKEEQFADLIDEVNWHKKNFFEDYLLKLVKGGDTSATIFANRTQNRDRGYNERVDINLSADILTTRHNVDDLELSTELKKELLKSLRKRNKIQQ